MKDEKLLSKKTLDNSPAPFQSSWKVNWTKINCIKILGLGNVLKCWWKRFLIHNHQYQIMNFHKASYESYYESISLLQIAIEDSKKGIVIIEDS